MSRNMNNFTPLPGPWQRGFRSYDGHTFSDRESNEVPVFYRSRSTHATDDRSSGGLAQQRFWDFRTPLGFHGIPKNNNAAKSLKEKEREKDEDGKRCAICLEDFESNEEVMLTPCKHMFHEDCIVPWLTSKGQCPVCRFVICERGRGNPSSFNNNNIANLEPSDLINGELLSILRAMEEAFQLGSITY
ncbi:E3 ubiquitin-protein ligase RNF38/44 [Spatholobus suberectus]|nr:E3 ubiquitin-protein ligase RNF38/44 [Spatholobus suberectus]